VRSLASSCFSFPRCFLTVGWHHWPILFSLKSQLKLFPEIQNNGDFLKERKITGVLYYSLRCLPPDLTTSARSCSFTCCSDGTPPRKSRCCKHQGPRLKICDYYFCSHLRCRFYRYSCCATEFTGYNSPLYVATRTMTKYRPSMAVRSLSII